MTRQNCTNCAHIRVCEHFKNHSANAFTCGEFINRHLTLTLPWPVGTTLYRVEKKTLPCKHGEIRYDSYWCEKNNNCLLGPNCCLVRLKYQVYTMENASLSTIVCNMDKANDTVFDDKTKAEARVAELQADYEKQREERLKEATKLQAYDAEGNKIDYAIFDTDYVKREPIDEE